MFDALAARTVTPLSIVCLCAAWCGVCRQYQVDFQAIVQSWELAHTPLSWAWVDVEDDAHLLPDALDVQTFPTVLIAQGEQVLFWGPVLPQTAHLTQLLQRCAKQPSSAQTHHGDDVAQALWQLVRNAPIWHEVRSA